LDAERYGVHGTIAHEVSRFRINGKAVFRNDTATRIYFFAASENDLFSGGNVNAGSWADAICTALYLFSDDADSWVASVWRFMTLEKTGAVIPEK